MMPTGIHGNGTVQKISRIEMEEAEKSPRNVQLALEGKGKLRPEVEIRARASCMMKLSDIFDFSEE